MGSWSWDLHTGERRWSDELFRLVGLPPAAFEPDGHSMARFVHPDNRARSRVERQYVLETGRPDGVGVIIQLQVAVEEITRAIPSASMAPPRMQAKPNLLESRRRKNLLAGAPAKSSARACSISPSDRAGFDQAKAALLARDACSGQLRKDGASIILESR